MEIIIIKSTDSITTQKIKDFLKDLKVTYKTESKKDKEKLYDPAFVKKILDTKSEKSVSVNTSNLWESIL
ncbi:MAG: hypothetical protein H7X99_00065 [Saprospiraceae bacterium]|nr:hypothetical protein [Saprospiraceae bacterium]